MPHEAREPDRGEELEVEVRLPDLVGDSLEGEGLRLAGVVHQDVDLADRLHHLRVGALQVGGRGDVAGHGADLARADRIDLRAGLFERTRAPREDRDVGAGLRIGKRGGQPKPLAAAGDDDVATFR